MNTTHTQGPWQVEKGWNGGGFTISSRTSKTRNERGLIADTAHSAFREQEEANVRLIAAAPEMLEALKAAVRLENDRRAGCQFGAADYAELHQQLTQAIAKATGGAS